MYRIPLLLLLLLSVSTLSITAQTVPIGHWRDHLPYRHATAIALTPDRVYCATGYSIFALTLPDHEISRYSKLNGLHDAGIGAMAWHDGSQSLVIGYNNGNIDILRRENITNIPDLLRKQVNGDKHIYQIAFYQDNAYLCTGFGIVVVNLTRQEVTDTYYPGSDGRYFRVNALSNDNNWFYAATDEGIRRAPISGANLANYQSWQAANGGLVNSPVTDVAALDNKIICLQQNTLYTWQQNSWSPWFTSDKSIHDITPSGNQLFISGPAYVSRLSATGAVEQTISQANTLVSPMQAAGNANTTWIADSTNGLIAYNGGFETYLPNSPHDIALGDLLFAGNTLWAAGGAVTPGWQGLQLKNGLFRFENEEWTNYTNLPEDLISLATTADNTLYAGSFGGGLLSLGPNGAQQVYKAPYLDAALDNPFAYRVAGLASDADGHLWIANYSGNRVLAVKKKDGAWQQFSSPYFLTGNAVSQLLIDDVGQKWIVSPKSNGLLVYNHGASIESAADDSWASYQSGAGRGNLPSDDVRCLAKDKDGFIWIGTARGIAVVQCPQQATTAAGCEAYLPILQEDGFAGFLFRNEQVNTIAVDGANRKWVGTQNGVWLISATGQQIISRFNTENSPLLSNEVRKIAIHPTTGEVFFATAAGLISYRGTATEGKTMQDNNALVFPNPVPPGYTGAIAIRGLVNNAIVKITDISGRLVYQTRAQGGQAVWNGSDYTGHRPQSGVYMVFSADDTGKEKLVTKIVFIH